MTQQATNALLEMALAYAEMGWHVLPVIKASKMPASRHGVRDASTDPSVITHWFKAGDANLAVAAGKSGFSVLDVDPRNGGDDTLAKLIQAHGALPETAMQMTGGGGEHYLFRVPKGMRIRNNLGQGLDGLNEGKYFLVAPSIHASGKQYNWEGSSDPLEGQEIAEAPPWMLEPIPAQSEPAQVLQIKSTGFLPPERVADIRSALGSIPPDDYHMWVKVGQALHSTDATEAFQIWDDWSKGSAKYNNKEMRRKWASFRSGGGLSVESIFVWAEQAGWVNPGKTGNYRQRAHEIDPEFDALLAERQNPRQYRAVERSEVEYVPCPVATLRELCSWFNSQLPVYHLHATQACVLTLAAALASRQYRSIQGDQANLYAGIIAESVGITRRLKSLSHRFMADVDQRRMIRSTRLTSPQAIYKTLLRSPSVHYVADDYGQMLQQAKRQPSCAIDQALHIISDVYQAGDIYLDPDIDPSFKDGAPIILTPCFSMLVLISDDQVPALTKRSELGRGALEQMIMVEAGQPVINDDVQPALTVPGQVAEIAQLLRQHAPGHVRTGNMDSMPEGATLPNEPKLVHYAQGALGLIAEYDKRFIDQIAGQRQLVPIAMGSRNSLRRLIVTLSAWDSPHAPRATTHIVEWAGNYVSQWLGNLVEHIELSSSESGKLDIYEQLAERIAKSRSVGLTKKELRDHCRPYRNLSSEKRDELLTQMLADGEVSEIYIEAPGKRPSVKYVHRMFVEEVRS